MKIKVDDIQFHIREYGDITSSDILIALHGFSGSGQVFEHLSEEFEQFKCKLLAVDLIGHGDTITPQQAEVHTFKSQMDALSKLIVELNIPKFHLLGYSMGGRLALHFAIQNPQNVTSLVLESTNIGISNQNERKERAKRDALLADEIQLDYPGFLKKWNKLPLFKSPKNAPMELIKKFNSIQLNQDPIQMAFSAREFSPGKIPFVINELESLNFPVLAITGELDHTYTQLWKSLTDTIPNGNHREISNAGHRVHLDQPLVYINTILNFIKTHK